MSDDRGIQENALENVGFSTPMPVAPDYRFLQNRIDAEKDVIDEQFEKEFQTVKAEKFIKKKESLDYIVRVNADGQYIDVWLKGKSCYGCKEVTSAADNMVFFS